LLKPIKHLNLFADDDGQLFDENGNSKGHIVSSA
jgi:hypothetical protein